MEEKEKFNWYSIRVVSGQEEKFKNKLEKEIEANKLQQYIRQIVVPLTKAVYIKDNKKITKEKPLYKGFVFIEMNFKPEVLRIIQNISGYRGFIKDKRNNPIPMTKQDIATILMQSGQLEQEQHEEIGVFLVGEKVKIIDGPLANFVGEIQEISPERKKVKVGVKIFGRKTPVEVSINQIEKIL